ncbi:MAG: tetratricopeptide repeat protein, partial [Cyanobacteria bacterium HKST-UBA02]|nr:tetratricopeptide repeat protein [Cyanobacteria bacterium HKST-UBA02]
MDGIIDEEKERYLFRTLQDESVVNWSTRSAYGDNYYERNNLDLFSRAARNVLIERALDLPPPRKSLVFHTAVGGLIAGDCIGDWQGANRCLRLISANRECNLGSTEYRNKFLDKLIDHLILTGRIKEAKTLMDGWIAFAGSTSEKEPLHVRFEGLWQALKRSAEIEMISDDKSLKPTLVQMQQIQSRLQHRLKYGDDIEWLADALAGSGDTKGAIAYFEKQKKFQTKNFSLEDELSLDTFSVAACPDVRIAKLKALEGDHDGALSTLTGLIDLMDKHLSSEKREQAEKIPFYFPARSDLEIELALVYEAKGALDVAERQARAAVLRIEKAQGSDAQSLRKPLKILSRILKSRGKSSESREISSRAGAIMPESKPDLTESQKFSLIQSTRNAILKDDTKEARTGITRLLEAYSNEAPVYDFHRRPINLFCSILSLSRDLCDHRQFGEADRVLDFLRSAALCKEHTPAALSMIDIEKALSAEARGNSKSAWAIVDRNNSLVQKENSFHRRQKPEPGPDFFKVLRTQENMRRFASLYSAAGYPDRADRLIRRALDLNKNNSLITSSSNLDMIESNIMLFLDGAVIRARQGRADEAMRLAGRAISISSDVVSSDNEHNGREFYGGRNYKTIQLAQILESKGHETEALALLEALGPKLASKTRHDVDKMSDSRDRWDANVRLKEDGIVHAYTARLQLFKGRVKDAGTSINLAIEQAGNNVPMPYYLLGARIAESAGNNAMAAHCYSEAARHESMSSLGVNISGTGLTRSNLEKSIGFAEKAPDLDRSELANIYVRFAGDLENSRAEADPKRALEYYLKASNLLPDSMERKVDLLRKIAALKQRIANQAQGKQATSNAGDGGGGPAAISAEEKERRSIAEAKSQIQAGLQAAKLAESTGRRDAFQLWIQLAYLEAQAREPEKALADARHGISLFRVQGDPVINFKGLLPGAYGLITSLCEQDKSVQAEALLQEANAKVSSIFGTKSPQYAYQLCQYFVFLLKQNRDADALKVLDRVLSIGIRRIEIGCSIVNPLSTIERTAEGLAREKRGELGLKIMERVLAVEKVELEKDDCRICDTLLTVSRVYSAQERFALAKESLDQALSIKRLYLGKRRAMAELAPAMMPVFKGL